MIKIFDWSTVIFGRVLAELICITMTWIVIAGFVRLFFWLDGSVAGGIDPVFFAICAILSVIVFRIWRFFVENDLEG